MTEQDRRGPWDRITLDTERFREEHNAPESLDEIVVSNCTVHLERMDDGWYYLGIYEPNGLSIQVRIGTVKGRRKAVTANVYGLQNADGIDVEDGAA
jgi:hypothetical protein